MEDKYYTPELEEFHLGFEFQYQDIPTSLWVNDIFVNNWEIDEMNITEWLCSKYSFGIRVKYLDKEDIESLGFKFDINITERSSRFIKDQLIIILNNENHRLRIGKGIIPNRHYINEIFDGTIKNKSELKKLMKQLGI